MNDAVIRSAMLDEMKRQLHETINSIKDFHIEVHKALSTIDDTGLSEDDQATLQEVKAKVGKFANADGRPRIITKP